MLAFGPVSRLWTRGQRFNPPKPSYLLIFQVCKQEPAALLHFLEQEALTFLVELKTQLNGS